MEIKMKINSMILFIFIVCIFIPICLAENIYVDNTLSENCEGIYSITSRGCSGNDGNAVTSISQAANVAQPGDIVYIREGSYIEQLIPTNSGTHTNPITYTNYNDEEAMITGTSLKPAIIINDKEYLIIDGLKIDNVNRWLYALNTNNCILRNNHFKRAIDPGHSQKACLFFQESNQCLGRCLPGIFSDTYHRF